MNPSNLNLDFAEMFEQPGLPHIRFHDLRHTSASLMLNHNILVIVASKRLGHSKPSITLDIYDHLYTERQSEAARIIDEVVTSVSVNIPANLREFSEGFSAENLHKTAQFSNKNTRPKAGFRSYMGVDRKNSPIYRRPRSDSNAQLFDPQRQNERSISHI